MSIPSQNGNPAYFSSGAPRCVSVADCVKTHGQKTTLGLYTEKASIDLRVLLPQNLKSKSQSFFSLSIPADNSDCFKDPSDFNDVMKLLFQMAK